MVVPPPMSAYSLSLPSPAHMWPSGVTIWPLPLLTGQKWLCMCLRRVTRTVQAQSRPEHAEERALLCAARCQRVKAYSGKKALS